MEIGKYIPLWKRFLPVIKIQLKKSLIKTETLQMNQTNFTATGDRESSGYTFNLEIEKGKVKNDISGTAVARDLYAVLNDDSALKEFFQDKHLKISMGKRFIVSFRTILL